MRESRQRRRGIVVESRSFPKVFVVGRNCKPAKNSSFFPARLELLERFACSFIERLKLLSSKGDSFNISSSLSMNIHTYLFITWGALFANYCVENWREIQCSRFNFVLRQFLSFELSVPCIFETFVAFSF